MSKCISSHGEYSEHEPGDPCPWCGEYDMDRIIAERDKAEARVKAVQDVLGDDLPATLAQHGSFDPGSVRIASLIHRALDGDA